MIIIVQNVSSQCRQATPMSVLIVEPDTARLVLVVCHGNAQLVKVLGVI